MVYKSIGSVYYLLKVPIHWVKGSYTQSKTVDIHVPVLTSVHSSFPGTCTGAGKSIEVGAEGEGAASEETKKKKKKKKKKGGGGGGATDDYLHPESNPTGQWWI